MMNIRGAAQDANAADWLLLTLAVSIGAFPMMWIFAWRRFSGAQLNRTDRLRLSAKVAAKAILPLWCMIGVVGFFIVVGGVVIFLMASPWPGCRSTP